MLMKNNREDRVEKTEGIATLQYSQLILDSDFFFLL